jgi:transposase InsO family protein
MFVCKDGEHRVLSDVYYIPRLRTSIVSLGQLDEIAYKTVIEDGAMCVYDHRRQLLARALRMNNRLYSVTLQKAAPICLLAKAGDAAWRWHARYGHLHFRALYELGAKNMVEGLPAISRVEQFCQGCVVGKQHRTPFPRASPYRAQRGLELVHGDLCGPISPATLGGNNYFLLIVDDHSRYMWVETIRTKDEALHFIRRIKALAENESGLRLGALRTDRGGEFNSKEFAVFCDELGIKHFTTAPYSPQQNGVVERRNQTVVEMARSLLKSMCMPAVFWGEAVRTAVHILNRAPTRSLNGKTPYEAWRGRKPNVSYLRTFGCVAHVKNVGPGVTKLADRSTPMVFIGYEDGSKAFRVYDPAARKLRITRDVVFEEDKPWPWTADKGIDLHEEFVVVYDIEPAATTEERPAPALANPAPALTEEQGQVSPCVDSPRSGAASASPSPTSSPATATATSPPPQPMQTRASHGIFVPSTKYAGEEWETSGLCLAAAEEPASVEHALADVAWRGAMEEEMKSILDNNTWELTTLPAGHRAIGMKWVFKVKKDPDGNIVKHKARLVAKGYAQRPGIDFDEVFAPVARMETVRLLLGVAAHAGWQVHHMDVKSAFLNGEITEEVYVQQPPGFIDDKRGGYVLRLNKALYGLRQAPRAWNAKLDDSLKSLGFQRCPQEHALYRRNDEDSFLLIGVYVDDLIITGSDSIAIARFKKQMHGLFRMSDLGLLSYYLGIEVDQRDGHITLCQAAYAVKILEAAGMQDCNPCHTPMDTRLKVGKNNGGDPVDATKYRSIIGSLRYLVNSRPDLSFAVGFASRFMEAPGVHHWALVKQILRYLKGTVRYGCRYSKGSGVSLVGYSDSDYAGDVDDRKSTSGIVFFLGPSIITWSSQKQRITAQSSCEAEYIAAATAASQAVWLSRLLGEVHGKEPDKVKLYVDNKSAIALCKNPVFHDRSKHIDTRFHYIRECVEEGKIEVTHVGTNDQMGDIFTKALPRAKFIEMRQRLGIIEVKSSH